MLFELKGNEFLLQQVGDEQGTLVVVEVKPDLEEQDDGFDGLAVIMRGVLCEEWEDTLEEL